MQVILTKELVQVQVTLLTFKKGKKKIIVCDNNKLKVYNNLALSSHLPLRCQLQGTKWHMETAFNEVIHPEGVGDSIRYITTSNRTWPLYHVWTIVFIN